VAEQAVINASPLIFFARSRRLELLHAVANKLWVPQPVAEEILQRGAKDITAKAIDEVAWLIIKAAPGIPTDILEWRLGAGESATLALAAAHGIEAIVDDLAGRKCAASLKIPVRGTLGIVLAAKQHRVIPQARPVIDDMMRAGLYLSRKVLEEALRRVGE